MTDLTTGIPSVHYRGYLIDICEFHPGYTFAAEDYDGPEDERCGWAVDVDAAKEEIDELEAEICSECGATDVPMCKQGDRCRVCEGMARADHLYDRMKDEGQWNT